MIWDFHRHTFDPDKWELVGNSDIYFDASASLPYANHKIYTNTCLTCGTVIRKKIKT